MSQHARKTFKLADGINVYDPEVVSDTLQFLELYNIDARLGRLITSKGYSLFQDLTLDEGEKVIGFGYYTLSNRQFTNFYCFTSKHIFWFDFEAGAFQDTPIYTFAVECFTPPVILPWYDSMYVTNQRWPYVFIKHKTVTVVTSALKARYGLVANSHVMLGNVSDASTKALARVKWSDIDAPEDFELNPNESEADFFDLEPSSLQITGMSYQRGSPLIYSQNDLWAASYRGFPESFKFEPIIPGLGNIFHDAVIHNKDVDYFISADNIYELNGFQPTPIGDKIFKRFIDDVQITNDTSVRGYLDSRKDQVFWVYLDNDDNLRSIVYNYKERRWTERDAQDLSAWFDTPRVSFRGFKVINDYNAMPADKINDQSDLIDDPDAGFPLVLPQLAGTPNVKQADDAILTAQGLEFNHVMETFDFYFDEVGETNEVNKCVIEYTGGGTPDLTIEIGTRPRQSADVTYSSPIAQVLKDGTAAFFFRTEGVGKFIRFRFSWNNDETNFIEDLRLVAITKVEDGPDLAEK